MTTNKKKIFITEIVLAIRKSSAAGTRRPRSRRIPEHDFRRGFRGQAQGACAGPRRGARRHPFRRTGAGSFRRHEGGDPDRRRLRRRRCSGAEPPQGPADGGGHRQFAVGGRTGAVHDADAGQARGRNAFHRQGRQMGGPARHAALRPLRQDRPDRRLRPHRHPHRQALPGDGNECPDLRSLQARRRNQGRRLRAGQPISMRRCRVPILSASIARKLQRRSECSTRRG